MTRLKDIASAAGVSITTVSRVMNGTADDVGISKATQEQIRTIARDMNYRPNREARNLRLGHRPQAILFLSLFEGRTHGQEGFLSHPFYGEMMHGIQDEVNEAGYYLAYVAVNSLNIGSVEELMQHTVSGVITWGTLPPQMADMLMKSRVPVASIEPYTMTAGELHEIYVDNDSAAAQAIQHLYGQGYRHIAMADIRLSGDKQNLVFEERIEAFQRHAAGYSDLVSWVESYDRSTGMSDIRAGELVGKRICAAMTEPTGVVAVNDLTAMGIFNAAEKARIAVPDQMGIVGIDDIEWAQFQSPPLTTVRIPKRRLAGEAVKYVCSRLKEGARAGRIVRVPVSLVVRESSLLDRPQEGKALDYLTM